MNLSIQLGDGNIRQGAINLKSYLDKSSIDGIQSTEIERSTEEKGQMGIGDILGSISVIIEAAEKPLVELVKCLNNYVRNYRTTIIIPTKDGKEIKLDHGRSMSPEELKNIVVAIQEANAKQNG